MNEPGLDQEAAFGRLADEFLERLSRGEDPPVEQYVAAHPELADLIRDGFPLLRAIRTQPGPTDPPAAKFGEFRIVRLIGRGGMGVVYEAVQESLGRRVALKVLSAARAAEPATVERFRREARTAGGLHHTNIVPVIAVGDHASVPYYAMQFIDGRPLDRVLRDARASGRTAPLTHSAETEPDGCLDRGQASPTTDGLAPGAAPLPAHGSGADHFWAVARIGVQVADALAYAHRQGVLHRDVKPGNLLLDSQGTVWVADFGLAKDGSEPDLTESGDVVGTLRYLAPERACGQADARSDVYALGATLYELATGKPAFDASDQAELLKHVMAGRKQAPRAVDPRVPRDLETVILRAMATEPGDRYPSAAELAEDLRRFLADLPVTARRLSAVELGWRLARRNPTVALLVTAVAVLLVASAGGAWWAVFQLRAENARTGAAERDARERLIQSRQDQARAALASRRPGQRYDSLAAVAEAAQVARELGTFDRDAKALRDLAAAALSLPDARAVAGGPAVDPDTVTLAVDARARLYVTGDSRGTLRVNRVADGQTLRTIPGPGRLAYDLSFVPGGAFVAAQYDQETNLRLWGVAGAPDYSAPINGEMGFSPDGCLAAVPDPNRGIILYDLAAGGAAGVPRTASVLPADPGRHVCGFDPAGERLVVTTQGDRKRFDLFDLRTRTIVQSAELPADPRHVAWDTTGRFLAFNLAVIDGTRVWDTQRGRWHAHLTGTTRWVSGPTFTPDGLVAAVDDQFHVWDPETGRLVLELGGWQMQVMRNPAGEPTAVRRVGDRLEMWEVTQSPVCRSWGGPAARFSIHGTAWVAGARLFAVGTHAGVELYDPAAGRSAGHLSEDPVVMLVGCPRDGSVLTLGPAEARHYRVSTAAPGRVTFEAPQSLQRLTALGPLDGGTFSPDGSALAIGLPDKAAVLLTDWPEGRTRMLPGLPNVGWVAVSPEGRWVAGSVAQERPAPHRLLVWHARTGEVAKRFTDDEMPHGAAVEFSPDGQWLVAGTPFDYRFFAVGSWAPGPRLAGSSWPGKGAVAFSPNGLLAVVQDHTSVGLRSADTLEEIVTLPTPGAGWVRYLDFSPDGRYLAVTCHNGIVHVWGLTRLRAELASIGLDWDTPIARPVTFR
jgi:serine/threonine protein kinase/WD40 repeat protein